MGKNDKETKKIIVRKVGKNVHDINLADYCTQMMLNYGANINLARAIPDIKDGLKVVGRRILYTMFKDEKLTMKTENIKSAKLVGNVLGKYHPHGDAAVYGSMVTLGQYWQYYPLLVKGDGAYGTVQGDGPAAMRYTEVNMAPFSWDIFFKNWNEMVVDFKPNYSNSALEPEFLPASFPSALVFGSTGMGYALYSGVPQYNLKEVANLTLKLIDNPDYKKFSLIPDFAMKCQIVNTDFNKISSKGEGTFRIRGEIIENEKGNLVVKSIPYQSSWINIEKQIKDLVKAGKITGMVDIEDNSTGKEVLDFNIELIMKKGSDLRKVKEILYKSTSLEVTFVTSFEFTNDYENVHYNIKSYILDWLDFRLDTKKRDYISQFAILSKEYHMLDTVIKIISKPNSDKILTSMMRRANSRSEIVEALIEEFNITDLQADVIADFKYSQLSKSSLGKYKDRYSELDKTLKTIKKKIDDEEIIKDEIKEEIKEIRDKYGRPRQCELIEVEEDQFIPNTDHILFITERGFISKLFDNEDIYTVDTGDRVISQLNINNRDSVLLFTKNGKCYNLAVNDIISTPADTLGLDIRNLISLAAGDKIVSMIKNSDDKTSKDMVIFVTETGLVKKTELGNFNGATKSGIIAILLKEIKDEKGKVRTSDKLKSVIVLKKNKDIVIYTCNGKALRFNSKEIPATLRSSSGVIGIRLNDNDKVVGMVELDKKKKYFVIVTSSGNAKRCLIENFEKSSRAKEGVLLIGGLNNKENIVGISCCNDGDTIKVYLNTRNDEYSIDDFKELTKMAKGKKLVPCRNNEHIIAIE